MKRNVLLLSLSILLVTGSDAQTSSTVNPAPFVIPALRQWNGAQGSFGLSSSTAIVLGEGTADSLLSTATILRDDIAAITGLHLAIKQGKKAKNDILLSLDNRDTALGAEGYQLDIAAGGVHLSGPRAKGVFWGTRTLLQLLEQDKQHTHLPCGLARDFPRYAVRGFMLDDGRKFFSLQFLEQYIRFMSYYKMNDFHLHLNDNGSRKYFGNNWDSTYSAFRLQSDFFPELTAKDGSYTKDEFRKLQALATRYGVTIIPEIDVPAHSLAFTKMRPEIGSKKYGMDHLDLDNPVTYQVIDSVFTEYLQGSTPVFAGAEVHIGTDEYAKPAAEQFRAFTEHYIELAERFGKKVRLWGALTHADGTTPVKVKDVTMNIWYNGYAQPKDMAKLGYDMISTPDGWLYIVPAAGYYYDYLNLKSLYTKWDPSQVGNVKFDENDPQIKGGSFAVWNDIVGNGITAKDVHDRVFPAMQVLAQKMWGGSATSLPFASFISEAAHLGEGPGSNMRGKITGNDSLVLYYDFSGKSAIKDLSGNGRNAKLSGAAIKKNEGLRVSGNGSVLQTPLPEIGYDYTVFFRIKPDAGNEANSVLFGSSNSVIKLKQGDSGKLGFSREGYDYQFDYAVPTDSWTDIAISGDHKGTSLYVNGELVQQLRTQKIVFAGSKDSINKVQTLFFPLQRIGDASHGFKGSLRELKVFNQVLPADRIRQWSASR